MRQLFDRRGLFDWLESENAIDFANIVRRLSAERYSAEYHGLYNDWVAAFEKLPSDESSVFSASTGRVSVTKQTHELSPQELTQTLMVFHPWRKGPFHFFGLDIDTEWRSDWKWERLQGHIDLQNKSVLDVGCGNGYYGWRMLADGARFVMGCEPLQLYNFQFEVFRRYAPEPEQHYVVPLMDTDLPERLNLFDVTFSMGVLYHRTSPIDHLRTLHGSLRQGGQIVLETLVLEDEQQTVLVPQDRYAKMRNVWFIPSVPMLMLWMERCGFRNVRVVDVSPTTIHEQRKTNWMTYDSLESFLDPNDHQKTFEGYPGPVRAILIADRG